MALAAAIIAGLVMTQKGAPVKDKVAKAGQPAAAKAIVKAAPAVPVKKAITKGKGALIVNIVDSKNKDMLLKVTAFKSQPGSTSVYTNAFVTNRAAELAPGTYDIEIATTPPMLRKNVKVVMGEERTEEIGSITGSMHIKALDAKMKQASYRVRVMYPKTGDIVVLTTANHPVEVVAGTYDVQVDTLPRQVKTDVKVDAGKEAAVDLGCTSGTLIVKALDENGKEVRATARVTKSGTNEVIVSGAANRPMDITAGTYTIELLGFTEQAKKDITIMRGAEAAVGFSVKASVASPSKPSPAKKTRF